jgi:hypothetical protein
VGILPTMVGWKLIPVAILCWSIGRESRPVGNAVDAAQGQVQRGV